MDRRKKKLWKMVLFFMPVFLFLACGTAKGGTELKKLADMQTKAEKAAAPVGEAAYGGELPALRAKPEAKAADVQGASTALVHICGEVVLPGVYEVKADSRICDVLLLAGGFTEDAATDAVNLAESVSDGMQVVIPSVAEAGEKGRQELLEKAGLVNINTASAEELSSLPGIGKSRAAAIIKYREKEGGFHTIEEIMQVSGIKEGMFEKLEDRICVE